MKKFFALVFFSLLTLISCHYFFHPGVPVTHDGNNHLVRFANYKIALRELQIPPRLAPNLLNGYGYPVFNYNYPLANILSLPFSILNFHYETTFKIIISLSVFFAFVGANLFLKSKKFKRNARIFSLLVFALNPYIFTSIIFRGNIGEIMAWSILPWIFYFIEKIKTSQVLLEKNLLFLTISLSLLLLAHNVTALFACILIGFYLLFNFGRNWSAWKKFIVSFIWAFAIALWFWLPAMLEKNLVTLDDVDLTLNYYKHFPTLSQLIRLPISFGYSYWGSIDSMSFGLGALQLILIFLSLFYLFKNKAKDNLVFILALFILILGQLPITKPLYDFLPFVKFIQFPWRLTLLISIVLLPISALIFENAKKYWKILLVILTFLQLLQFIKTEPIDYRHKDEIDYDASSETTSVNQENMPKSFTFAFFETKQEPVFILKGAGQVTVKDFFGSYRHYLLQLEEKSIVVESTAFFPGWQSKVNGQKINYLDNEEIKGRIAYELEAGQYEVSTRFTQQTWPRIVGNSVSAFALLLLLFVSFDFWQKDRKNKKQ